MGADWQTAQNHKEKIKAPEAIPKKTGEITLPARSAGSVISPDGFACYCATNR
jgi:hypothetical protein